MKSPSAPFTTSPPSPPERRGCKGRLKSLNPPLSPFEKGGREGGF